MLFFRTDILWVAVGQITALIVGLLSLKVFTNLLTAEQYAYIALMMAMSAWIWTGIYQPLNQAILRFYSLAESQGWKEHFLPYVLRLESKLALWVLFLASLLLLYGLFVDEARSFLLLVILSACMGMTYGMVHGLVSFFLAQRKRKQVAILQSADGLFRLCGGVAVFYWFSQTEYALATGVVIGGLIFFTLALFVFRRFLSFGAETKAVAIDLKQKQEEFSRYFYKMFVVMLLNASVTNLDKWLLFYLIGADSFGKYAALYILAMAMASAVYFFFEMLGFPLIFKQEVLALRQKILHLMLLFYILSLGVIVIFINYFGEIFLLFMTTPHIAMENETFTLLILACGTLNLGRLLMVDGLVNREPSKYWPAYLVLLIVFIGWCLLFVGLGDNYIAAQGFMVGVVFFVTAILVLNRNSNNAPKILKI